MHMAYKATHRFARIAPRKARLVADLIRGMRIDDAMTELDFSKKRAAWYLKGVLKSAIANAENNHQLDVDRLYVSECTVGKSLVMKRWRARARGRVGRIVKPFSNLRLVVREREETN